MNDDNIQPEMNHEQKRQLIKATGGLELYPYETEQQISAVKYTTISLSQLTSYGTAFEPLKQAVQSVFNGSGGSGLYKVTVPKGGHLASFKDGSGYLGGALNSHNQVGIGQARLNPIVCNPTMIFMAATLANIDRKLDKIMEMQRDLMDYLVQKDRAEQIGDLNFLSDAYNNYKYNWNNEKYITSYLTKVQDIKQASEQKIEFFRTRIASKLSKKSLIHMDHNVEKQMEDVRSSFKDYQLAIYLYSFASFMEVLFLENFDSQYLTKVVEKINYYSEKYADLYEQCCENIEDYSKTSIQSVARKLSAGAGKGIGNGLDSLAGKVKSNADSQLLLPENDEEVFDTNNMVQNSLKKVSSFRKGIGNGINNGISNIAEKVQNDRSILNLSDKISQRDDNVREKVINTFREDQSVYVRPFIDSINSIDHLYNDDIEMLFDDKYIYIGAAES